MPNKLFNPSAEALILEAGDLPTTSSRKPKSTWGPPWLWIGVSPSMVTSLIALFAPPDILDRIPFLWIGVHWLNGVIPSMPGYMRFSMFPQVTGATFLIAWVCFPVQLVYVTVSFWQHADPERFRRHMSPNLKSRLKYIFCFLAIGIGVVWSLVFHSQDPRVVGDLGMALSRAGLAIFSAAQFLALCFSSAALAILVFKLHWKREHD